MFKYFFFILLLASFSSATILHGTVYGSDLNPENDVLIQLVEPIKQTYLAKNGTYRFDLLPGNYTLLASKGLLEIEETIAVQTSGQQVFDLFLIPTTFSEEELWQETDEDIVLDSSIVGYESWRYWAAGILLLILLIRLMYLRKKYGPLPLFRLFRRKKKVELPVETKPEFKNNDNDDYGERVMEILQQYDGRMTQKELRQKLPLLSEAGVSLLLVDLEQQGKITKIKHGRGNVVLLKK